MSISVLYTAVVPNLSDQLYLFSKRPGLYQSVPVTSPFNYMNSISKGAWAAPKTPVAQTDGKQAMLGHPVLAHGQERRSLE